MTKVVANVRFVGGIGGEVLGSTNFYFEIGAHEQCENSQERKRKGYNSTPLLRHLLGVVYVPSRACHGVWAITDNNTPEVLIPYNQDPLPFIKRRIKKDVKALREKFSEHNFELENDLLRTNWQEIHRRGSQARYDADKTRRYVDSFVHLSLDENPQ
jgi:hypothetical protein